MSEYDAIISLGAACKPAHNIRRYFGNDRAFPFDWWISGPRAVETLIGNGLTGALRPENLVVIRQAATDAVYDRALTIAYQHEFPRDEAGFVVKNFVDYIPKRQQRFRALADRMDAICARNRVLFVRQEHAPTERAYALGQAAEWLQLFRAAWPEGAADLLLLDATDAASLRTEHGTAYFDTVPRIAGDGDWQPLGFNRVFKRHGIVSLAPRTETRRYTFKAEEHA